jgi:hypothetical protein
MRSGRAQVHGLCFLHIAVHSSGIGHSHVLNAAMNNVLVLVLTMGTHQGPNLPPPDVYRGVGVCVFHHVVSRDMMENTYPHTPTTSGAKFGPGWPQRMQCRTPQGLPEIPPTSSVNTSGRHSSVCKSLGFDRCEHNA